MLSFGIRIHEEEEKKRGKKVDPTLEKEEGFQFQTSQWMNGKPGVPAGKPISRMQGRFFRFLLLLFTCRFCRTNKCKSNSLLRQLHFASGDYTYSNGVCRVMKIDGCSWK